MGRGKTVTQIPHEAGPCWCSDDGRNNKHPGGELHHPDCSQFGKHNVFQREGMEMTAAEFGKFLLNSVHEQEALLPVPIRDSGDMAEKYLTSNDGFYVRFTDGTEYRVMVQKGD